MVCNGGLSPLLSRTQARSLLSDRANLHKERVTVGFWPGDWRFRYLVVVRNPARLALEKVTGRQGGALGFKNEGGQRVREGRGWRGEGE